MQNELSFFKVHPPLSGAKVRKKKERSPSRTETKTELSLTTNSPKPNPPEAEKSPELTWPVDYSERESSGDNIDLDTPSPLAVPEHMVSKSSKSSASYKEQKKNEPTELFPEMTQPFTPAKNVFSKKSDQSNQGTSDQSSKNDSKGAFKAILNDTYRASVQMLGLSFRFALTPDEKYKIRRFRIRLGDDKPIIPVRNTKYAELKEAYSGYCGRPPTEKNWLYEV